MEKVDLKINQPYLNIVLSNYKIIETKGLTDDSLSRYIAGCFDEVAAFYHLYKAWACVECLRHGDHTSELGDKPENCPKCGNPVFEIGSFQARASRIGRAFEYAFMYLMSASCEIELRPIAEKNKIYDFEYKVGVVIETKGSSNYSILHDGTHAKLNRAGMKRSDTSRKAFSSATKYRRRFPNGRYYIVTNANPEDLVEYNDDDVSGIYNITQKSYLDDFVKALTA